MCSMRLDGAQASQAGAARKATRTAAFAVESVHDGGVLPALICNVPPGFEVKITHVLWQLVSETARKSRAQRRTRFMCEGARASLEGKGGMRHPGQTADSDGCILRRSGESGGSKEAGDSLRFAGNMRPQQGGTKVLSR